MQLPVTAVILTFNEERNLPLILQSLKDFVHDIYIIDSFSTDGTQAIAAQFGAKLLSHAFETHSKQWAWALATVPATHPWMLGLDADQVLTEEVKLEIRNLFSDGEPSMDGYYIKRKMFFLGKWIRHGGYYPLYLLKLFKREKIFIDEGELMEHHFYVNGTCGKLNHPLLEDNKNETLDFWLKKHIKYAQLQVEEEINKSVRPAERANLFGNQNERKLFLKTRVWLFLPLFLRPTLYFTYRYFLLLGFLDGKTGLIFHFLQGFWYRFYVDSKIYEYKLNERKR